MRLICGIRNKGVKVLIREKTLDICVFEGCIGIFGILNDQTGKLPGVDVRAFGVNIVCVVEKGIDKAVNAVIVLAGG